MNCQHRWAHSLAPPNEMATGAEAVTDTERVQALLGANDRRMRQASIADEFD